MGRDIALQNSLQDPNETVIEAEVARAMHPAGRSQSGQVQGDIHALRREPQNVMWDDVA